MSKVFSACPLFDAHKTFVRLPMGANMLQDYPDSQAFIDKITVAIPDAPQEFLHTQSFLKSYSRKSEATYRSYRNEVERLLLWSWTVANKSIVSLRRADLEAYFDFVHSPPANWVALSVADRFRPIDGQSRQNQN